MAWKPKERELTPEEAVAQAKAAVAPLWFNSSPLLIAIRSGKQTNLYPLDPAFKDKKLLVAFCDLFDPTIETVFYLLKEWMNRYHSFGFVSMVVFQPRFKITQKREVIEPTLEKFRINFPVCTDTDGSISAAMGVKSGPAVVLFCDGEVRKINTDLLNVGSFELEIQDYLRKADPGLSLLKPFVPKGGICVKSDFLALGKKKSLPEGIVISGEWREEGEGLSTVDSTATITFDCKTPDFSLVAVSPTKTVDVAKILVEMQGAPVFDEFAGGDLRFDDSGLSYLGTRSCHRYHVLKNLPENERSIVLSFPNADKTPVTLLGLIFHS